MTHQGTMVPAAPPACLCLPRLSPLAELGTGSGTRKVPVRWSSFSGDPFAGKRWTLKPGEDPLRTWRGSDCPPHPCLGRRMCPGKPAPLGRSGTHRSAGVGLRHNRDTGLTCFPCSFGDRSEGPQRWEGSSRAPLGAGGQGRTPHFSKARPRAPDPSWAQEPHRPI